MKLLVVEDDLTLSTGICFELDSNGYLTVAAYNCKKAHQLIQSDHFDLAILDVNLPDAKVRDMPVSPSRVLGVKVWSTLLALSLLLPPPPFPSHSLGPPYSGP